MARDTEGAETKGKNDSSSSFLKGTWQSFKSNKFALFSLYFIGFMVFVAVFADFLAYGKPYYAKLQGKTYYPLFYDYMSKVGLYKWDAKLIHLDWGKVETESAFWPPVKYDPKYIDVFNGQRKSPFGNQLVKDWKFRHFLGTDEIGHDVLSGLIHGTRISLTVGLVAVGIASFIGILLGAFSGYFGDSRLRISRANLLFSFIGGFLGFFYGFFLRFSTLGNALSDGLLIFLLQLFLSFAIFIGVVAIFNLMAIPFAKIPFLSKKVSVWVDIVVSRIIEIVVSIPQLLLIISISAIASPSLYLVMVIIGFTAWTTIARLTRGEMLKVRNQEYMQAAQAMGFSEFRIILKHALPNVLAPVFVSIAFGISSAILLESSLSFLGIGVPPDVVTWGSLLQSARGNSSAWWLAIFPGLAIFATVTVFNLVGEGLRDALDPKLKNKR
ncbi:MAG: ABC transporter permease [Bacteroidia bacterium]|nr:ABC transporter permease [Bacteroidia bacterium]